MAIASGLTMAIANPSQDILVGAAFASDLLLNKEDSDIRYIEFSGQAKERREEADAKKEALLRQSLQASEGSTVTANQPGNTEVQDGAARQNAAGARGSAKGKTQNRRGFDEKSAGGWQFPTGAFARTAASGDQRGR